MENELQETFDKHGIKVYREDSSVDELLQHGYRKVSGLDYSYLLPILQTIPRLAKDMYYKNEFQKAFNNAVQDTYRLILDPSLYLGMSHTTPGAFKGNAYDIEGRLRTHADWIKNNPSLDISQIPQLAACLFDVASSLTGQYYLSQINTNICSIKIEVEEIKQLIENLIDGEIITAIDGLEETTQHLQYIISDQERRQNEIQKIHAIEDTAKKYIVVYKNSIEQEIKETDDTDNRANVEKHIRSVTNKWVKYRLLVETYCHSKLLEIILSNITNSNELSLYYDKMNAYVEEYILTHDSTHDWIISYLNNNHSLNQRGVLQKVANVGLTSALLVAAASGKGRRNTAKHVKRLAKSGKMINKTVDEKIKENKRDMEFYANSLTIPIIESKSTVKSPLTYLSKYITISSDKVELIIVGDDIYTSLPE